MSRNRNTETQNPETQNPANPADSTQNPETQNPETEKPTNEFKLSLGDKNMRESLRLFTDRLEDAYDAVTDIETEVKTAFRKSGVILNRVNVPTGDGARGKVNISAKTPDAKAKIREFVDTLPASINIEFSSDRAKGIDYYTISF